MRKKDHNLFSQRVSLGFRGGKMEDGSSRGETCPQSYLSLVGGAAGSEPWIEAKLR